MSLLNSIDLEYKPEDVEALIDENDQLEARIDVLESSIRRVLLMAAAALTFANFLYQALTWQRWETAFERSFFQAMALLVVYIAIRARNHHPR